MQRVDNSTYTVTEAMVDSSSTNRLNIVCRINNIPNILGFSNMNINRVNKNGNVENMARMQSLYDTLPGYQRPALVQSSATMQAVGVYSVKNPTLGISVPVASLTCNDGLQYNCSLAYDDKQGSTAVTKTSTVVRNLTVSDTTKEEQGASNPNVAPVPQYAQSTKKRKSEYDENNRPKPLPRKGPKPGTEFHYAEFDLNQGPHKAPRRKGRGDTVQYAEVEFKEISI